MRQKYLQLLGIQVMRDRGANTCTIAGIVITGARTSMVHAYGKRLSIAQDLQMGVLVKEMCELWCLSTKAHTLIDHTLWFGLPSIDTMKPTPQASCSFCGSYNP